MQVGVITPFNKIVQNWTMAHLWPAVWEKPKGPDVTDWRPLSGNHVTLIRGFNITGRNRIEGRAASDWVLTCRSSVFRCCCVLFCCLQWHTGKHGSSSTLSWVRGHHRQSKQPASYVQNLASYRSLLVPVKGWWIFLVATWSETQRQFCSVPAQRVFKCFCWEPSCWTSTY